MTEHRIRLETKDLSVGYEKKTIVEEVSFTVRAGEVLVLLGPNGSGKSTLLKSIAGQLDRIAGTVFVNGRQLQDLSAHELAKEMSLLLTDRPAAELMTCREVASAGRYPYTGHLGILSQEDWKIVDACLARMGAAELAQRPFQSLSDGQRQRVLLARALCQEPEVLVLDEPASFLDIRYQLELAKALRTLAKDDGLSVIVSLHDIDLARRCADRVLCLKDGKVDRYGDAQELLMDAYLETLFSLEAGSLSGKVETFSHYTRAGNRRLRMGYTTGTCAALAAAASVRRLLCGNWPEKVGLRTPKGLTVEVTPEEKEAQEDYVSCGVRKDAGDDVDCTMGALICVKAERKKESGIEIRGGKGVGTVTKPGLDQPVGEAAINSVPRQMITQAVENVLQELDYTGGIRITVFVPEGEELAKKTFNPNLGIEGGISILGTSGIVEPMSRQALVDTITLELRQKFLQGARSVILTPGNYGKTFLEKQGWNALGIPVVKCSNFIGEALDEAGVLGYEKILLVGHIGKLVKLAGGIMNTHSREADCRCELICAHAALCGADRELCRTLMSCATTDACLALLREASLMQQVMESLTEAVEKHLKRKVPGTCIGAVIFSNEYGILGMTQDAGSILGPEGHEGTQN